MYTPPAFRTDDLPTLHAMMRAARLATLITATAEGPLVTPLPLLLAEDEGEYGVLYGHVARANAQWSTPATGPAVALFMGPDAYVSPGWYAGKHEHGKVVPTWNYTAVQAAGPAEFFDDADRLRDIVTRLTDRHEAGRPAPWAVSDAPDAFIAAQLRGIVGLRLPIARLEGKRKLSQNRTAEDRTRVADALAAGPDPADQALAALIPR